VKRGAMVGRGADVGAARGVGKDVCDASDALGRDVGAGRGTTMVS
jgi:hypothetical protein